MKVAKHIVLLIFSIFIFMVSYHFLDLYTKENSALYLRMQVKAENAVDFQLFYSDDVNEWSEEQSTSLRYDKLKKWEELKLLIPDQSKFLRLDTGKDLGQIKIKGFSIQKGDSSISLDLSKISPILNQLVIKSDDTQTKEVSMHAIGEDPFFYFKADQFISDSRLKAGRTINWAVAALALVISSAFYFATRYIRESVQLLKNFLVNRELILSLAKNDFKTKYASSYLGVLWGFINPLLTIVTYWFVFQVGLRNGDVGDTPFIIWFIAGIIPWFFFSDALSSATNVFTEYSYLVKKVVFKIELLPIVKIMSAFFVQLFFIVFIFIVYAGYGRFPTMLNFQLIYYLVCLVILAVSLSFFTSAIFLFFRDLNQIIAVILQIGFWFTPIGWSVSMLSDFWTGIFKLNPMFYIVQGYRDSLIDHILFFNRPYQTVYFWLFCFVMFTLGLKVFKKLKPHFSDVL